MKKRLIICLIVVGLLLSCPIIQSKKTSVNKKSLSEIQNVSDEEIQGIAQKIVDRLKEYNRAGKSLFSRGLFNKNDPDGPLEGGMDDISDLISLFFFISCAKSTIKNIITLIERPSIIGLFAVVGSSYAALIYLGEALDTKEFFNDGR